MARSTVVVRLRAAFSVALTLALFALAALTQSDSAFVPREAFAQDADPACDPSYVPSSASPTFATDKPDYAFNEIAVVLNGDGYGCGASHPIRFTRPDGVVDDDFATADAVGHLSYEYWVSAGPGTYVADVLSADGASVLATTSFSWSSVMVLSDKTDYRPGERVTIFGADWAPGESVELHLQVDPKTHADEFFLATADELGDFVNDEYVVKDEDLGVTFLLRALGQTSGLTAQTTFTDHTGLFFSTFGAQDQSTVTVDAWSDSDGNSVNAAVLSDSAVQRSTTNSHYARVRNGAFIMRTVSTALHESVHLKFYCRGDSSAGATDLLRVSFDFNNDGDFTDTNEGPHNFTTNTTGTTGNACPDSPNNTWSAQKDIDLSALSSAANNNANLRIRFQGPASGGRTAHVDDVEVVGTDMCGNGTIDSGTPEQCDEGAANGTPASCCTASCTFQTALTVCNPGSGDLCDPVEVCSGSSGACPTDTIAPAGTVCNPGSGDLCDPSEVCSGTADQACPADTIAPAGTVCNSGSGDLCDPNEVCSGTADQACPTDTIAPAGTVCNPGSGDLCDPNELCSGTADQACPADTIAPAGTVCNPGSGDLCDPNELCSGTADQACPADTIAPAGTVCNPGSGDLCDPNELCSGTADQACPADAIAPAGTVCNPGSGDLCDPNELCSGAADQACPVDTIAPAGTVCNPGSGDLCDPTEFCSGAANQACPADTIAPAGTVCDPGSGDLCDPDEVCSGAADQACPVDTIAPAGTVCDPGSGDVCDPDEVCSGTAEEACPADTTAPAGTVCREAADQCDVAEECSGISDEECPTDGFVPDGTSCTDPDTCQADACQTGECTPGAIPWSGVLQPINADGSSIFKLGSTIPVKFRLTGECTNVSLVAKIYLSKVSNSVSGDEIEATSTSAADSGNTFRWSDGQYIYNLATKPLSAGTWRIRIDLGDNVTRTVLISLKK